MTGEPRPEEIPPDLRHAIPRAAWCWVLVSSFAWATIPQSVRAGGGGGGTRPNVLVILTDDQKADWFPGNPLLTTNGRESFMPVTEASLMARGVTFRNAFVTNPV